MKSIGDFEKDYLRGLMRRSHRSRVYTSYQSVGLEIANILGDWEHRTLFIKLVKDGDPDQLMRLAKSIGERKNVDNKGAYFIKVLKEKGGLRIIPRKRIVTKKSSQKKLKI